MPRGADDKANMVRLFGHGEVERQNNSAWAGFGKIGLVLLGFKIFAGPPQNLALRGETSNGDGEGGSAVPSFLGPPRQGAWVNIQLELSWLACDGNASGSIENDLTVSGRGLQGIEKRGVRFRLRSGN